MLRSLRCLYSKCQSAGLCIHNLLVIPLYGDESEQSLIALVLVQDIVCESPQLSWVPCEVRNRLVPCYTFSSFDYCCVDKTTAESVTGDLPVF